MANASCFITLEGLDGAGKSTHFEWIQAWLHRAGIRCLSTREPGGTPLGERLRQWLLTQDMQATTETLLMFAARSEHWHTVIEPALKSGQWVLCDRFTDASYAYQGGGRQLGSQAVAVLDRWVMQGRGPDCTILLDLPWDTARTRIADHRGQTDRFEQESAAFFQRVRRAYLQRAEAEPRRFRVVDASQPVVRIQEQLDSILTCLLEQVRPYKSHHNA